MISRSLFLQEKKLRVLDFDDTLVKTDSYVYVTHINGTKSKLSSTEFAIYNPIKGDVFDFSEFDKVKNPIEIKKITNVLRRIVQSSGRGVVYILTARRSYLPIKRYLHDIGINSSKVYVVALASNNPEDKAKWLEYKIDNEGYDDVYFADDSQKNIETAKRMLKTKNIKWRVQHVKS
jgi:phosphoglycolate phosphatase-like HAD superfamily hydrolase